MKHYPVAQGSEEWSRLRMGKPTASCFDRIITAAKGAPSSSRGAYLRELVAELILGHPIAGPDMPWMKRGSAMEEEAVAWYAFEHDVDPEVCGFCTTDDGLVGASPDRFIGEDGLLEIKCPSPGVHVGYLLCRDIEREYRVQTQGQLYVTGRKWLDIVSYHPEMPKALVRIEPDAPFHELLKVALNGFCAALTDLIQQARERGWIAETRELPESEFWITEEDVDIIFAARAAESGRETHIG